MATIIQLERRLTHRYKARWSYMDEWERVGKAKILQGRQVDEGNGIEDAGAYLMHARIPAGQDAEKSREALRDHFTTGGCAHDYDCCGCLSTDAYVKQITPRTFSILLRSSRNY